ncbi:MAG TPA: NAD(P)/FAD-dependent oxidoreductase [Gemmatimonadales bacterium]|nr:NAD(P)/FAD-dependent oxidoreductase [Gemmatimonadales bacterium]
MYDVTIIGAGLAGLQLARLLARGGASVLLVDARRSVADCVRTTGIFVRRTFEDFPVLHPFLGPAISTIGLHSPGDRVMELECEHDEFRVGRMHELYRAMLRQVKRAGAEWRPATTYRSMQLDADGARLTFRDGTGIRSRFVVGADGARSRIARDLGLDRNTQWIAAVEHVHPSASPSRPRFDCWIDPAIAPGYLAWAVDDGKEMHVGVGGDDRRFHPASALRTFEQRLRRDRTLRDATLLERRGGLIPVNGILRRIACGHGLLVGDAAGAVSPLTAGGLDACMRLSSHAAAVLLNALHEPAAIRAYSGAAYRSRFASRLGMRRMFDVATRWPSAIELGFVMARTSIAQAMVQHVFFGRGSFPDADAAPPATGALRFRRGRPARPRRHTRVLGRE